MLAFSDLLMIESLKKQARQFLEAKITRENAIAILKRTLNSTKAEVIIDKCLLVIAKHYCMYDPEGFKWLPLPIYLQLIRHDHLNVNTEYDLYKNVCSYVEAHKDTLSVADIGSLFEDVRFIFMSYQHFEEVISNPLVPRQAIIDAGMVRLALHEAPQQLDELKRKGKQ
jgi:hypothetical protein